MSSWGEATLSWVSCAICGGCDQSGSSLLLRCALTWAHLGLPGTWEGQGGKTWLCPSGWGNRDGAQRSSTFPHLPAGLDDGDADTLPERYCFIQGTSANHQHRGKSPR